MNRARVCFCGVCGLLTAVLSIAAVSAASQAGPSGSAARDPKTILDRVYSVAQAERGEATFKRTCTGCHAATDFAGGMVASHWEGGTLDDLFDVIAKDMPANDPGSLTSGQAADVIAFFLHMDGYPVGTDDLPGDAKILATIGIVPNPK